MINIEFCRNEWIPALRSGRYKQIDGTLMARFAKGDVRYCCLGVAARRLGAVERSVFPSENHGQKCDFISLAAPHSKDERDNFMPHELGKKIGLLDGQFLPVPESFIGTCYKDEPISISYWDSDESPCINLALLNDELMFTFDDIANVIELACAAWESQSQGEVKTSGPVQMKPTLALIGD